MEPGDETTGPDTGATGPGGGDNWEEFEDTTGSGGRGDQAARARETAQRWLGQLQVMIDNAAREAGPVLRDVAAKAAELAAVAGENAGPIAHKAADVTERVGVRVAARSKELAADLHRQAAEAEARKQEHDLGGPDEGPTGGTAGGTF